MMERVTAAEGQFDLIHFHVAPLHFPVARRLKTPHLTTLHGRLDLPDLTQLYQEFGEMRVVSISNAQRMPLPHANWFGTVYHGIPESSLQFHETGGNYFAFIGRISPEKRLDRAIAIAKACGYPLRIAAKVDPVDAVYFERDIRPLLDDPLVTYLGEIGHDEKVGFLGNAAALLFPIDWPEPFGLVMIEALACGTPVVAFRGGSVGEIIENGVTGFIVENLEDAVAAARRAVTLDRRMCRTSFERRFTSSRMARDYVDLYRTVADAGMPLGTARAC
jgi:glycosyltransferase involved in cell wall biosynthesis